MYNKYVKLRDEKNVTDYAVAEATGINKSTFTDWKTGRSEPKISKLAKIAAYFGVNVDYFVNKEVTK